MPPAYFVNCILQCKFLFLYIQRWHNILDSNDLVIHRYYLVTQTVTQRNMSNYSLSLSLPMRARAAILQQFIWHFIQKSLLTYN